MFLKLDKSRCSTIMEELKFEAPLAQLESEDFMDLCSDFQSLCDLKNNGNSNSSITSGFAGLVNNAGLRGSSMSTSATSTASSSMTSSTSSALGIGNANFISSKPGLETLKKALDEENNDVVVVDGDSNFTFSETFSGSLEDLVNTFDEKITKCFCNYDENTEKLAPVQMRTQEELMNECQ